MIGSGTAHVVAPGEGRTVDLGVVRMRVLAGGEQATGRAFTLAEFAGGAGKWTVPHAMQESFFILEGEFTFGIGDSTIAAHPGTYVLVPHGTRHMITAGPGGGRLLTLMVPGGLEDMFFELGELGPASITDTATRVAIAARYDSVPA